MIYYGWSNKKCKEFNPTQVWSIYEFEGKKYVINIISCNPFSYDYDDFVVDFAVKGDLAKYRTEETVFNPIIE